MTQILRQPYGFRFLAHVAAGRHRLLHLLLPTRRCPILGLARASKVLGRPERCELAHAILWEHSYKRLRLVQRLGQLWRVSNFGVGGLDELHALRVVVFADHGKLLR